MPSKPVFWTRLHGLFALVLVGAALYYLLVAHREHVLPYLPFLILLLCPLMHLFMHKGHGGHDHGKGGHPDVEEAYHRGLEEGRKDAGKRP